MITPSYSATATERVLPRMALDFTTASLDSRVTITRALNTATAVNASGYVATVNANLPRFDYDPTTLACKGLLIEESRSNVCIQSADIENVAWSRAGVGVVGDTVTSPAGTTTGNTVTCSAGSSVHRVVSTAGTVTSGASATHSVFVKAGTHSFFQIHDGSTGTFYANFNLTTGTVTAVNPVSGATITPYGNGWYKCTLTLTAGATTSIGAITIIPDGTSLRNPTWAAAGTESIYAWGYQIEVGAFATSYIPTLASQVTRNADVVSMTGTNFSDWFNASEGTLACEFGYIGPPKANGAVASINNNTTSNRLLSVEVGTTSGLIATSTSGFSGATIAAMVIGNTYSTSLGVNTTQFAFAYNGNATTQQAGTINATAMTQLEFGGLAGQSTRVQNIYLKNCYYYPQRLTNNEIRATSK
jgi:hypothetical protein